MTVPSAAKAMEPVHSAWYGLCGETIEVSTTDEVVAELITSRLRFHARCPDGAASIVFDIRGEDPGNFAIAPRAPSRPVYDAPGGQVMYCDETDQLFIDYLGSLRMLCHSPSGLVETVVCKQEPGRVFAAHPFFTIPLIEAMKRRRHYPLHAACLAIEGRGLLLAGSSGSGKSTLSVSLVRVGWDYVSDDMVFLEGPVAAPSAWGLMEHIDVGDQTASMFHELRYLVGRSTLAGRGKHAVDVERAFGVVPVPMCRPVALVFPAFSGERKSVLRPISPSAALRELAPNVLLTDAAAAQAHLAALAALAGSVPCFSLSTGTDLDHAADCLLGTLA